MNFVKHIKLGILALSLSTFACTAVVEEPISAPEKPIESEYACFSGIYPHLAFWSKEGECGTGALAVWNNKLWALTYGPHCDKYSTDKLYEIDDKLNMTIRKESVGGTHANRLIHPESKQLFIGCYAIDADGNVRTISREAMHGRLTGTARSPWSPEKKIFMATMEEGLYEIDVDTLAVKTLIRDGNLPPLPKKIGKDGKPERQPKISKLHGYHGKGFNSGYGKLYYSNNGVRDSRVGSDPTIPSGALAQYSAGDDDWTPIRIMQFTEIATPDGIYGNLKPDSNPIWAVGFDAKSVVLMANENGKWTSFRLPKASHSYDGSHGWNTEWPRIREIGEPKFLMTMHGAFWEFPPRFGKHNADGIRMASNYLKVVGDFCVWQNKLVLGCDDSAQKEFLNKRDLKSETSAPGQSNSNLVFMDKSDIFRFGPNIARGSVFLREDAKKGKESEPMFIGGFERKIMAIDAETPVLELQIDFFNKRIDKSLFRTKVKFEKGDFKQNFFDLDKLSFGQKFDWIKITPLSDAKNLTVHFEMGDKDRRTAEASKIFDGIALRKYDGRDAEEKTVSNAALMLPLGEDKRIVALSAFGLDDDGNAVNFGTYAFNWKGELKKTSLEKEDKKLLDSTAFAPKSISYEADSILVVEDGKRYRLPLNGESKEFSAEKKFSPVRVAREVATERDLLNCGGIFYELPAKNALGFSKIRPIASHNLDVFDYCSYRGLMLVSGANMAALEGKNPNIVVSEDKKFAIWAGSIDDLWKLGKCVGRGSVWFEEPVENGQYSDPLLFCGFDKKTLYVNSDSDITLTMELDIDGTNLWVAHKSFKVEANKPFKLPLEDNCQAYWVRLKATGSSEKITTTFIYE